MYAYFFFFLNYCFLLFSKQIIIYLFLKFYTMFIVSYIEESIKKKENLPKCKKCIVRINKRFKLNFWRKSKKITTFRNTIYYKLFSISYFVRCGLSMRTETNEISISSPVSNIYVFFFFSVILCQYTISKKWLQRKYKNYSDIFYWNRFCGNVYQLRSLFSFHTII